MPRHLTSPHAHTTPASSALLPAQPAARPSALDRVLRATTPFVLPQRRLFPPDRALPLRHALPSGPTLRLGRILPLGRALSLALVAVLGLAATTTTTPALARAQTSAALSLAPTTHLHLAAPAEPVDVAHRGASAYAPENTVAAFELADRMGADYFELDVQETKDHELVLMHDTTLSRTTDVERVYPSLSPWRVGDLTLAQIRRLDAGSWSGSRYADEPVPTLDDALTAMADSGLGLLLEVKAPELYPGIERRVADELRRHAAWQAPGRLIVQSFNWESMRTFHRYLPDVAIGLLGTPTTTQLPQLAKFADLINPSYTTFSPAYVRRVHALGMRLLAWTVDSPSTMRRMLSYGVDGIITNRPDVLNEVLSS
ncbi:glycerophosphodiester phosphodiesterase [Actinomadura sp. ATCC 31491]|uniref:Glycerophosphodiester phosphodiesterase n=1 Tax=Actinomadura luzonensis TaxID=2805427 RepID=A0ABT0G045_9ACTN|nr:glycerophosphodiester phosphodiesterase family protein [Actinomadura luzonensis]MCK2217773.1 glycerophosphodiester phosphodiesterase [Actinomadura luzonensis]